jgi:hypothetical protein
MDFKVLAYRRWPIFHKANKYKMLTKKKGKLNTGSLFKGDNGRHL